jgi:DNA-binding transcriptional regulator YdaS (Cro superfamily)
MYTTAISQACAIAGGTVALAKALGVKPPTVSEWVTGKRRVPPMRCVAIERITKGRVSCDALRPDIEWGEMRAVMGAPA